MKRAITESKKEKKSCFIEFSVICFMVKQSTPKRWSKKIYTHVYRKLSTEEWMLLNYGVGENSWESLGLQGDQTSQSLRKSTYWWLFTGKTDAEVPVLWPPMWRANSLKKTLILGKIEDRRRRGWQRTDSMDKSLSRFWEMCRTGSLACCSPWGHKELDTTEQLNNKIYIIFTQQ